MSQLDFYDGSKDKPAAVTKHTVAATSCGIVAPSPNDSMTLRRRGRDDWSFFYCEEGRIDFDGQEISAGEAFIYPPTVPQRYRTHSRDRTRYAYLHFSGSCVSELFSSLGLALCTPIAVRKKGVFSLFSQLSELTLCTGAYARLREESLMLLLFSYVTGEDEEGAGASGKSEAQAMKAITDKMAHCFAEEYDVRIYADMLHLSPDRFQHLFKDYVGVSPYAYYVGLRMDNAARLLADTDLKIKAIAECSGYRDPLYFTQAFRKHFGVTPREYRKCKMQNAKCKM